MYRSVAKSFVPPASSASSLRIWVANDKFFFPPGLTKTFSTDNMAATGSTRSSQPRLAERMTVLESPGERGKSVILRPRAVTFPPLKKRIHVSGRQRYLRNAASVRPSCSCKDRQSCSWTDLLTWQMFCKPHMHFFSWYIQHVIAIHAENEISQS